MTDFLDSPEGQRAVEAIRSVDCRLCGANVPLDSTGDYHDHGEDGVEVCRARPHHIAAQLTAALPHLDRMFRERYAKELEAEAMRPHRAGIPRNKGWYEAASFLWREPTL